MPQSVVAGWRYLEKLEPWGERRLDFLFGMLASVIYNVNRGDHPALKPADFIEDWDRVNTGVADPFAQFEAFAEQHNESVKRRQVN